MPTDRSPERTLLGPELDPPPHGLTRLRARLDACEGRGRAPAWPAWSLAGGFAGALALVLVALCAPAPTRAPPTAAPVDLWARLPADDLLQLGAGRHPVPAEVVTMRGETGTSLRRITGSDTVVVIYVVEQ